MATVPQISDAEWEVMKVIWETQPVAAAEIVERLAHEWHWSPRTIKTMLNRLVGKGAVDYRAEGKRYIYRARVTREACVRRESRSFLSRVFDGAAAPAVLHLLTHCDLKALSSEEVQQLRELLDQEAEE
jgi:BlaI family penicillinase repressor